MIIIETMKNDTLKKLRTKVDQLWQIASHDACGKHVEAVAQLYYDIQKLFSELGLESNGKPLVQVFAEEERKHASKVSKATEIHGNVRSQPRKGSGQMPT